MTQQGLEVVVDGTWLSALMTWGDLDWSTVWPGGSESLQFSVGRSHRLFRPDAIVELHWGGACLWCGTMLDPTRGAPIVAEGLFRKGEDYPALQATGYPWNNPLGAQEEAVARGLPWVVINALYPTPGVPSEVALDPDHPHSLAQVLDASALQRGEHWGVNPQTRGAYMAAWPTTPAYHMLPGIDGLGITREGYADALFAPYLDSSTGLYKIITAHDMTAHDRWGHVEHTIAEPLAEGVAISSTKAQQLIDGLLVQGRSQIGWTSALEVQYGDVVNEYGQPVALPRITAGQTIRLHGLAEDISDLAGRTWTDMHIARVDHPDKHTAVIEPTSLASPMTTALADSNL